jgi:hypothetical protein
VYRTAIGDFLHGCKGSHHIIEDNGPNSNILLRSLHSNGGCVVDIRGDGSFLTDTSPSSRCVRGIVTKAEAGSLTISPCLPKTPSFVSYIAEGPFIINFFSGK